MWPPGKPQPRGPVRCPACGRDVADAPDGEHACGCGAQETGCGPGARLRARLGDVMRDVDGLAAEMDAARAEADRLRVERDVALMALAEEQRLGEAEREEARVEFAGIVRVGVAVVLRREDGRILMGQRKGPYGGGTWSVPGGKLDRGETPIECAARELAEETGLHGIALRMLPVVTHDYGHPEWPDFVTLWAFGAVPTLTPVALMEPDKCATWQWFTSDQRPTRLFRCFETLLAKGVDPWTM